MPVAVVHEEPERRELKSCPGGYVDIKRMTYGEKLQRRAFIGDMEMKSGKGSKDVVTTMKVFNEAAELYDFAHAIVGHNLTDVDERPLVFTNPGDVKKLTGRIAEEIGQYIDEINNFEEDDETGN